MYYTRFIQYSHSKLLQPSNRSIPRKREQPGRAEHNSIFKHVLHLQSRLPIERFKFSGIHVQPF